MKFCQIVLLPAAAAALCCALAVPPTHVQHERRNVDHPLWEKRDRVHRDLVLPVRVGLNQRNLENGYDLLMEISHPSSPKYGQHYTEAEIHELFAPAEETIEAVRAWIVSVIGHEHIGLSHNRQWLQFDIPTSKLEDMLHTEYHEYEHGKTGKISIGCDEYHLPADISPHVDYITPGAKLVATKKVGLKKKAKRQSGGTRDTFHWPIYKTPLGAQPQTLAGSNPSHGCDFAVTPRCVRKLYGIHDTLVPQSSNSIGVYETETQFISPVDLDQFFATFATNIPNGTFPSLGLVDGAPNPQIYSSNPLYGRGGEPALDFELIYPLVYPEKIVNYQADDLHYELTDGFSVGHNNGLFNTLLDAIDGSYCNYSAYGITGDRPGIDPVYPDQSKAKGAYKGMLQCGTLQRTNVISISYGLDEASYPVNYQKRQCNEFMKLSMQGTTIVSASGDTGVYPGFSRCLGPAHKAFGPSSPNVCPYVLAVGSTYLPPGATAGVDAQHASTQFGSGGGFSNIFTTPSYQAAAVSNYFANYPPPYAYYNTSNQNRPTQPGRYNRAGRGYPDVSATGENVAVFNYGPSLFGGTSCGAPIWSSIFTRINSARIGAGKSTVGFVHPTLYAHPEAFTDIVVGSNPGCHTAGFRAVPGWDPVTGLGTPVYPALKSIFMSLP